MRDAGLTRTATCRVARGIDETTGEVLPARMLAIRVRYLARLVAECGQAVLDAHWDADSIAAICSRQASDGRRLPLQGYNAVAKLWGPTRLPAGVKGSCQVGWMGAELAARQLRSAAYRLRTCAVLLVGGLPSDCPDVVSGEAMRRRIGRRLDRGEGLPDSVFDLEPAAPQVPVLVPLSVCNQQFFVALTGPSEQAAQVALDADLAERRRHKADQDAHYYKRKAHDRRGADEQPPRRPPTPRSSGAVLVARVRLPAVARPTVPADWSWHRLTIRVPARYQTGTCSPPTLRVTGVATIRADVAITLPPTRPMREDDRRPVRVLGVDWGVRRLLSASVVRALGSPDPDGCYQVAGVDGRPLFFQAGMLQGKVRRIGFHRARLQGKADQWARLAAGLPEGDPRWGELDARCARARIELADLAAAQSNLNEQIARLAARWLVEQALAAGCQAIALENLRTLQHRGRGKRNNERCALALRGKVAEYTRQAAATARLAVVTVSPRGTSALCPRCGHQLTHLTCPGGPAGHAWAWCGACSYNADRDHAAGENVGKRAVNPAVTALRHKPTRRRGLRPSHRRSKYRGRKTARGRHRQRAPAATRPPRTINATSAATVEVAAEQAGPAAARLVIPPPHPDSGVGNRSAGPGPRCKCQAGHIEMHAVVLPTWLDGLLTAYRTSLRATPVLYREAPWAGVPGGSKKT